MFRTTTEDSRIFQIAWFKSFKWQRDIDFFFEIVESEASEDVTSEQLCYRMWLLYNIHYQREGSYIHCVNINLNLGRKIEPVTAGAVYVRLLFIL